MKKDFIKVAARIGTSLLLMVLVFSCASVPVLRDESSGTFIKIPFVRVLIDDNLSSQMFKGDAQFAIECLELGEQSVYYSNRPITVTNEFGKLTVENRAGDEIQSNMNEVNIIPRGNGNRISVGNKRYRGIIKILPMGESIQLINILYIEDYLKGVVPPEIGPRTADEIEAVKAQAVAARTYAMAHLKQYPNAPYDLKASIIDQVYQGANVEKTMVNEAIESTAGNVLMYQDKYINAYYHSTCGGATDHVDHVWDRKESPYLKAVKDNGACSWSKFYNWKEVFTEEQLRGRIEQYLSSDRGRDLRIDKITDVTIKEFTPGGRVAKLFIHSGTKKYKFLKDRIRWVLGRTSNPDLILPSDRFIVDVDRAPDNSVRYITFTGSGYGHGVGMCQCGAIGMSRKGWEFQDILTHYYTGVEVKKLY